MPVEFVEVRAAELPGVLREIAEEVDLLERRAEAAGTGRHGRAIGGGHLAAGEEDRQAHQANDLRGAVNVLVEGVMVVGRLRQIAAHRAEERADVVFLDAAAAHRAGVGVQHGIGVERHRRGEQHQLLVVVEQFPDLRVGATGLGGGAVDDFVGDAHHGVEVADVLAFALPQHLRGQGKRRRIRADDRRARLAAHPVVLRREPVPAGPSVAFNDHGGPGSLRSSPRRRAAPTPPRAATRRRRWRPAPGQDSRFLRR